MGRGCNSMRVEKFRLENLNKRDHLEDIHVDGKTILKSFLEKNWVGRCGMDSSSSGKRPVTDFHEPSGSIKGN
jgi:hypothetical protein